MHNRKEFLTFGVNYHTTYQNISESMISSPTNFSRTFVQDKPRLQGYYFSQDFRIKNFGDALGAVIVNALGYQFVAAIAADNSR